MKPNQDRPIEVPVTLKDGRTIYVRELNWGGYKRFKSRIVGIISEKLSPDAIVDIAAVMKSTDPFVTGVQALRSLATLVSDAIDELTPLLVSGCLDASESIVVDSLGPMDMLKLRDACSKVNDLDALIGLEGNALAAAVNRINALTAGDGGSGSKPTSPPATGGASLT